MTDLSWLLWLGVGSLVLYEGLAALSQLLHWLRRIPTISERVWRFNRRRRWAKWALLACLVVLTLHLCFHWLGYGDHTDPHPSPLVRTIDPCVEDRTCVD